MCLECPKKHKRFFSFYMRSLAPFLILSSLLLIFNSWCKCHKSLSPGACDLNKEIQFCPPYHSNADVQALQLGLFLLGGLLLLLLCLDSFVCLRNMVENYFIVGEKVFLKILKPPPQSPLWVLHNRCHYPFWKKVNVFTFTFLATKRQLQRVRSEWICCKIGKR